MIGGGLVGLGDDYLETARAAAEEASYVQQLEPAEIIVGRFADTAGVIGAALVALDPAVAPP